MPAQDAFYTLPDSLLSFILSKIPIRDAVKSCILSKRWRFLYTEMPQLTFSPNLILGPGYPSLDAFLLSRVENIISKILLMHSHNLEALHLHNAGFDDNQRSFSRENVCKWVMHASWRNVQHLTLLDHYRGRPGVIYYALKEIPPSSLFSCSRLVTLCLWDCILTSLPVNFVGFPHLITCTFRSVQLTEESLVSFISLCPLLQKFVMTGDDWLGNVVIFSSTIEHLNVERVMSLSVNCPKLKIMSVEMSEELNVNGVSFYELSASIFHLEMDCGDTLTELSMDYFYAFSPRYVSASRFLHIVGNFQSLKGFAICLSSPFEREAEMDVPLLHLFHRLPNLQWLHIMGSFLQELARDPIPVCLTSPHVNLKKIRVEALELDYKEIAVISCLLQSTPSLETMEIQLSDSSIPVEIGRLVKLEELHLSMSAFTGRIPSELGLLTVLKVLDLSQNNLSGSIPSELMGLRRLLYLRLDHNVLSGEIPASISNLSALRVLDLGKNELTGRIPQGISELHDLEVLALYMNQLTGPLPPGIVNLKKLLVVLIHTNLLTGTLPPELGLNASFTSFEISLNNIGGLIPPNLCHGGQLQNLSLHTNHFSGPIPQSFSQCHSLVRLTLQNNELSGDFPSGLWSAPNMTIIRLENNRISGTITPEIRQASQLAQIQIDNNQFRGAFPPELSQLQSLYKLSASQNLFTGNFPPTICNCPVLSIINVSQNSLSGKLAEFSSCKKLVSISFAENNLEGEIPPSLGTLPVLTYLDLSTNKLTGNIPSQLANLKLVLLNLSFNRLSGRVPASLISSLPASYLEGNPGLCGTGLSKPCTSKYLDQSGHNHKHPVILIWTLITVFFAAGIIFVLGLILIHRSCNRFGYNPGKPTWNTASFCHLGCDEDEIVSKLDEKNVVGSGGSGKVYKVILPGGEPVAVKRLWTTGKVGGGRHAGILKTEIETLGKVCHRNIVKLLCCSSSEETSILVYEFVPNGSLADVLHSSSDVLDWPLRFKIAMGAAQGLAYLHHDYEPQVLHRDIKSNNILLDSNYEPKLADFGLGKILGETSHLHSMSSVVGSYGYIAPEYTYSAKVDEKSDVYSFGVVLLELITGKKAVEVDHGDLIDVVKWVRGKVNTKDGIWKVLDPKIRERSEHEMVAALRIALLCTSVLPQRRPSMQEVVERLQLVKSNGSSNPAIKLPENISDSSPLP